MPNRNPFEETLRAGREPTVPEFSRDTLPRGGWTPDLGDIFRRRGVGNRDTTTVPEGYRAPDEYGRMRPEVNPYAARIDNNPMRGANIGGGWNQYEGAPQRVPQWEYLLNRNATPMSSGEFLSSRYGGGLDDVAGMNGDARGMLEDAGFEVAGKTTDDRAVEKLWGKAVNKFPPGTPDMILQQEWERLKQIYFDKKYGGPTLPSRDDIVGMG